MRIGYLSPKLEVVDSPEKGGKAVFAKQPLASGELVALWGGYIIDQAGLDKLPLNEQGHTVQVSDGHFLAPLNMDEPADQINHSCQPNCGLQGQIMLVAMREIQAGEEITFDYAMTDSSPFDEFECGCGATLCRGKVTQYDWMLPDLWKRDAGYFSPYLANKIKKLKEG